MFKGKAGLKTLSIPFVPPKIKLYRKLLYMSKFMLKLTDQCPKSKFIFSQLHTSGLRRWKTPCFVELHRAWMGNPSTAIRRHTLPSEAAGLLYPLKSHNILQVSPLVVHYPLHDITVNTLDTSSLGNSTGSGPVMAGTGDSLRTPGTTKLGWNWHLDAMPRASRRPSAAASAAKE